jgi:hypothetical protein
MRLVVGLLLVALEVPGCTAIEGERIVARDLSAVIPSFLAVEQDTEFGPSPSPGVRRILSRAQLARLAATVGLASDDLPESLCLERKQAILDPAAMLASLESAARELFPAEEVRVEMLDYLRYPLPPGLLSFRRQGVLGGLGKAIDAPVLWRGSLTTKAKRSLPVWAKARVLVRRPCWTAKVEVAAGVQPAEEQFENAEQWLNPFQAVSDCADPRDKKVRLRRLLRPGQRLLRSDLAIVPPVRRGESVHASLEMASATLSFDAVAEMDGTEGQSVLIKRDGRRLRARVTGTGAVQVTPGDSK